MTTVAPAVPSALRRDLAIRTSDPVRPRLVLAAHGSRDPRWAAELENIAARVAAHRPDLAVRIAYLDHAEPRLSDVATASSVVVPMLLGAGYHATVDIADAVPGVVAAPIGPDPRLALVLAARLGEAGWCGDTPVVLAAAGSRRPQAIEDVNKAAGLLAAVLGVPVTPAFTASGEPRLDDLTADAVASYVLAPGHFASVIRAHGAAVISAPIGAHPLVADVVLDRYDEAVAAAVGALAS